MSEPTHPDAIRKALLSELASITTMARGTLAEEFREKPAGDGSCTVRLGPYFKHQVWEEGRNRSTRVPAVCVDQLREQMQNAKRFDALTQQLAALATEEGAAQRAALISTGANQHTADAKKNSRKNACRKDTRRPKPVSRRSSPGFRRKDPRR
jgi:mannitol-1-phosphate/altronate dehydrogenase